MKFLAFFALLAVASAAPAEQAAPSDRVLLNVIGAILANLKPNPVEVGPAIVEPISVGPAVVDNFEPISVGPAVVDNYQPVVVGPAVVDNFEPSPVVVVDTPIIAGPAIVDSIVPTPVAVVDSPISASPADDLPFPYDHRDPIVFHIKNVVYARDISGSPVTITRLPNKHSPVVVAEPIAPTPVAVVEGEIAPTPVAVVEGEIAPTPVAVVEGEIAPTPVAVVEGEIAPSPVVVVDPNDPTTVAVVDSPISASPAAGAPAFPYPFDGSHPMVFHIDNVIVARDISGSPVTVTPRLLNKQSPVAMVEGEIAPSPVEEFN